MDKDKLGIVEVSGHKVAKNEDTRLNFDKNGGLG